MTAEVELLPCPFCGGAPGVVHTTDVDDTKWVHVECYGCGARTRGDWIPPSSDQCPIFFQEVRAEWNRRANVSHAAAPLQAEIEALRAERDALRDALREAQTRIAAIGYPASPDGKYNKNGEWTFSDAVPRAVDAEEVEAAFLVIRTALAAHRREVSND